MAEHGIYNIYSGRGECGEDLRGAASAGARRKSIDIERRKSIDIERRESEPKRSPSAGGGNGEFALRAGRMREGAGADCGTYNKESGGIHTGAVPIRTGRAAAKKADTTRVAGESVPMNEPSGKKRGFLRAADAAALICAIICTASLTVFSLSGKEGTPSDYVPAAITFTPPEQLEPKGFWDYFAEAVAKLFGSVGQ